MTPKIDEIHAMLTELVEKQRADIQSETDRVAREKAEEEIRRVQERKWKEFVFEENRRHEANNEKVLDYWAAKRAQREQAERDAKARKKNLWELISDVFHS